MGKFCAGSETSKSDSHMAQAKTCQTLRFLYYNYCTKRLVFCRLLRSKAHPLLGGGFKYIVCSPLLGEMIQFDYFFSDGLKPPTSLFVQSFCWEHIVPLKYKHMWSSLNPQLEHTHIKDWNSCLRNLDLRSDYDVLCMYSKRSVQYLKISDCTTS